MGWLQVRNSMTVREFAYDKAAVHSSDSLSPGGGWSFNLLTVSASTSSTQPVAAVVYNAVHDQQTRAHVLQWLDDTYDIPAAF